VLLFLLLSLFDHANSAQNNQDRRLDHVDDIQGNQVTAGFVADGIRYHSDYFDFTYSLPDVSLTKQKDLKAESKHFRGLILIRAVLFCSMLRNIPIKAQPRLAR